MLRRTLLVFAAGALLHASGRLSAQTTVLAYEGPSARADLFFGDLVFANVEFGGHVHPTRTGDLVSA